MYPRFHHIPSRFLPLVVGGTLLLSTGPDALRTVVQASLLLARISLELCQMGLAVLRVCGI
jgi:hypothetical protein